MKLITLLLLAILPSLNAGDPRIRNIEFLKWGNPNQSALDGECVPYGKVWLIRHAGIAYAAVIPYAAQDWEPVDWMLQIKHYLPSGGWHLIPIHRPLIPTASTPTLATEGQFIMIAGEALQARANWIREDKMMALMYIGWEFNDDMLPQLLGIAGSSTTPALDSLNREIQSLETQLQAGR